MVSDYLMRHPSGPFFSLSKTEYEKALAKYPDVSNSSNDFMNVPIHSFTFFSKNISVRK